MLVECPRCHFKQPQDQYCASCGVDMLAYKPKEQPILSKIFESGLFQFLMVVFLGVGVTYFVVRTDQPQKLIQRINRFASTSPIQNQKANTEAGIAEDQGAFEAPPPEANTWAARSGSGTAMSAALSADASAGTSAAPSPTTGTDANPSTAASATAKLQVQMVEIDHDYLNNLMGGRATQLAGDITSYRTYSDFVLDKTMVKFLRGDTLDFTGKNNLAISAGNNSRWIRLTANVLDIRGTSKFWDMEFIKNHPNDAQRIPFDLTLRPGEKFIISGTGIITYFDLENDLASVAPFSIFKSPDYRNQKTTFAIIIELQ